MNLLFIILGLGVIWSLITFWKIVKWFFVAAAAFILYTVAVQGLPL